MTEKQITEEDRAALRTAIHSINHRTCTTDALIDKIIQALHSRGWRRREDALEEAAVVADNREFYPGHKIAEDIRSLKDTP